LSAGLISLHLDSLICGEDCFPHACRDEAFASSIGIPPLDEAIIIYLHHGLSQALFFWCCYILVSLWTHLLVGFVWEGHVLHRVSHSFKTILMLNAHPCISLLKVPCHDSHTPFWLSPFLICLFFMLLNHVLVASAKLFVFLWSLALVVSFYWFWGSDDPILCTLYPYTKILYNAQIMGSFSSFLRILIWSYHKIFRLLVSIGIFWSLAPTVSIYWFWGSYDPILCMLYAYTKILYSAQIMGSFSSFFRTLFCPYHNIF
jgi:hypothetical protein